MQLNRDRFGRQIIAGPPQQMLYKVFKKGDDSVRTTPNKVLGGLFTYKVVLMAEVSAAVTDGWFVTMGEAKDFDENGPVAAPVEAKPVTELAVEVKKEQPKEEKKSFGGFGKVGTPRQGK